MLSAMLPSLCSRTRRRVVLGMLFLLALAVPLDSHAQSTGDGSIYSRFGVGMLNTFTSPQSQAMGGGGYALRSLNYNAVSNPALWSDQVLTRLHLGAGLRTIEATDAEGATSTLASGTLEALQFSFPLYERKIGMAIAFQPYSISNYQAQRLGQVTAGAFRTDTLNYQVNFEGVGGLQLLRSGLGARINDALRVGASLDVIFGIIESQRSTRLSRPGFAGTGQGTRDAVLTDGTRLAGVTGTVGGHLALADVLTDDDALSVGLSFTFPTRLSGERVRTIDESLSRDTLETGVKGDVTLPWELRLGTAYQPDERWTIVADGLYAPWSTADSDFAANPGRADPFPVGGNGTFSDRWRVSAGAEVLPAGNDNFASYISRMAYRIGAYAEQLNVQPDASTNISVFAGTAGLSLPTSLSGTRIDLNLSVGTRGTTDTRLVRDTFYELSFHVNIGERWFQERKLR